MASEQRPVRILHAIGGMDRGGIETWLMQLLRNIDRHQFRMEFLVHATEPRPYDDEVRRLGSVLRPCLHPRRPWMYAQNFKDILRQHGPYDVVHAHVHHFNGYILKLAAKAGVSRRIAHSHNDTRSVDDAAGMARRGYLALTSRWIAKYATRGIGVSARAAACLFGADWQRDSRWRTLSYALDFTPFRVAVDRAAIRAELGIPANAFVMGHVGRFVPQKNHSFLLRIAADVVRRAPEVRLVLVGEGPLRREIESEAARLGLSRYVIFAGPRDDVPRLMIGAMDLFLLPSQFEGLGLVLVEAQAAGLHSIAADVVPEEAVVVEPLVRRLSLAEPASGWADLVLRLRQTPLVCRQEALQRLEDSSFNIRAGVREVEHEYQQ